MFFKALACDYDGTLASEDRIGPAVREALGRARKAGLRLILVTGRTFFELTRVCECLELFDAVVAENGAVLYYPGSAMIRDQGPPVPGRLLAELDRRGIYYQVGRVIVGTARGDEGALKEALAAAGVTRDLIYNRAALMLLPAGVSKGSGVQQALRVLGLSPHDVLAPGDAENDLPLFDACGFSGCPGDSLPAVRERVDWVFPGVHGDGIAAAITEQILPERLTVQDSPRHRISIGWVAATSGLVTIPARGVNVLIHGDPHSGKSWLAGALVERLVAARYSVCVIDPEGDYRVLAHLPGVTWTEVHEPDDVERALDGHLQDPAASTVLDLSSLPQTVHVRHLTKYVDSCVPPGQEFRFRGPDGRVRASADSLHSFRRVAATAPDNVLAHHAEHGDFSRWVRDVFADAELARQLRKIEARWRRRELADLRRTLDALITVRYGADE